MNMRKMVAKIDDSRVTDAGIEAMSAALFKALENRLRNAAKRKGLSVHKYTHPVYGDLYSVSKGKLQEYDLTVIELRDYLY